LPNELNDWLETRNGSHADPDVSRVPAGTSPKSFIVGTVKFNGLNFRNHEFNPRNPNESKVNELLASIRRLALLNPLVCAFLDRSERKNRNESVVLIDGRHRYEALSRLAEEDEPWRNHARIDVKIYYGLNRSELFLLSTYLNRNRRALKKGEYYRSVVRIYEERRRELESHSKKRIRESQVVHALHGRELTNRDFDLSIGRLVGSCAFDPRHGDSWYPLVGSNQNQLLAPDTGLAGFAPLTAGNLSEFLRHLCRDRPYDDFGEARERERENVLEFGRLLRKTILRPVADRGIATATTVGCKFWVFSSFGRILASSSIFKREHASGIAPLASKFVDWDKIQVVLEAYRRVAEEQAIVVNRYRDTSGEEFLDRAWSYQTQRDQVGVRLLKELRRFVPERRVRFA
jgi:ParB-like nuclease family protein